MKGRREGRGGRAERERGYESGGAWANGGGMPKAEGPKCRRVW